MAPGIDVLATSPPLQASYYKRVIGCVRACPCFRARRSCTAGWWARGRWVQCCTRNSTLHAWMPVGAGCPGHAQAAVQTRKSGTLAPTCTNLQALWWGHQGQGRQQGHQWTRQRQPGPPAPPRRRAPGARWHGGEVRAGVGACTPGTATRSRTHGMAWHGMRGAGLGCAGLGVGAGACTPGTRARSRTHKC